MITAQTFQEAIELAVEKHKGQYRKGDGRPYILHPLGVVKTLYSVKKSKNMYLLGAAAALHDVVEDCGVSIEEIADRFGYHVASLVKELTLDKKNYRKMGKKEYVAHCAVNMSSYALTLKLCDRLDNVSDLEATDVDFTVDYIKQTNYLIEALELGRDLTRTQKKLVKMIKKEIKKQNEKFSKVDVNDDTPRAIAG